MTWQPSLTGASRLDEIAASKLPEFLVSWPWLRVVRSWTTWFAVGWLEGMPQNAVRWTFFFAYWSWTCGKDPWLWRQKVQQKLQCKDKKCQMSWEVLFNSGSLKWIEACRLLYEESPEEVQESSVASKAMSALPVSGGMGWWVWMFAWQSQFFLQHLRIVFFFVVVVVVVVAAVVVVVVVVVVVDCCVLTYLGNFPIFFFSCHFQI